MKASERERALARAAGDLADLERGRAAVPAAPREHGCPPRTVALTLALGAVGLAVLVLGSEGSALATARNAVVLLLVAVASAGWSIGEERRPDGEDMDGARVAKRFSPLAIGASLSVAALFPSIVAWGGLKAILGLATLLTPFLHVGRVRAIHLFLTGLLGLGATALDPRAAPCLLVYAACAAAASAFDRENDAQREAGLLRPVALGLPLGMAAGALAAGGALYALAWFVLPERLPTRLPDLLATTARRPLRPPVPVPPATMPPIGELVLLLLGLAAALLVYHLVSEWRQGERSGGRAPDDDGDGLPLATTRALGDELDPERAALALPEGPRRDVVRRYLRHLERLRKSGTPRPPSATPRELARFLERRVAATTRPLLEKVADLFGRARWSEEAVSQDEARGFELDADAIERD